MNLVTIEWKSGIVSKRLCSTIASDILAQTNIFYSYLQSQSGVDGKQTCTFLTSLLNSLNQRKYNDQLKRVSFRQISQHPKKSTSLRIEVSFRQDDSLIDTKGIITISPLKNKEIDE